MAIFLVLMFMIHIGANIGDASPFLLDFGPGKGDRFLTKTSDTCSREIFLLGSLRIGSQTELDSLFVCTNGYITFTTELDSYNPDYLKSQLFPVIAPFFADISLADNLLDKMCNYSEYYDTLGYKEEKTCVYYRNLEGRENFTIDLEEDFIADDDIRLTVFNFDNQTFIRNEFFISTDDDITMLLMGNDTIDPNLGNNVFFRNLSSSDLNNVSNLIKTKILDFNASWGFVATWYKVTTFPGRLDAFNSFQTIVTCDEKDQSDASDDRCFVIFDYYEIQWTYNHWQEGTHARSGINDGNGFTFELPFSGMPESRNWWVHTNFDIPGIWVMEIDQTGSGGESVFPVAEFELGDLEFDVICDGPVVPDRASINKNHMFSIPNCSLPTNNGTQVHYYPGQSTPEVTPASYDPSTFNLTFSMTQYSAGPVVFALSVNKTVFNKGVLLAGYRSIYFFNNESRNTSIEVTRDASGRYALHRNETAGYFKLISSDDQKYTLGVPVYEYGKPEAFGLTCESWDKSLDEAAGDYSLCEKDLGKWYGCPQKPSKGRFANLGPTDAWWAHSEVANGMTGWRYDICCNKNHTETRALLEHLGYCRQESRGKPICEFSSQADFCIVSPSLGCMEINNTTHVYVSNRCCYDTSGSLLKDSSDPLSPYSVGGMSFEENSLGNMMGYFYSEMLPYLLCCDKPGNSNCSDIYKEHRPTVTGDYSPRGIVMQRGDPHLQTVDGIDYPLMVLGVYTMLETNSDPPTVFQASTRRKGNGTVFSGFVTAYGKSHLECFIWENSTFVISINGHRVTLGVTPHYVLYNISVTESEDLKSFRFHNLGNQLIIRVVITDDFLNIFAAVPPDFEGQMDGLLGHYDGDPSNDFTAKNGSVVDAESDHQTIHSQFGESWRVSRNHWLFRDQVIFDAINVDIENGSPFEPQYEIEFENEELRAEAELACNGNFACMLDVSLVGDIQFAQVFENLTNDVNKATFFEDEKGRLKEEYERRRIEEDKAEEEEVVGLKLYKTVLFVVFAMVFVVVVVVLTMLVVHLCQKPRNRVDCGSDKSRNLEEFERENTWENFSINSASWNY